ncbi:B3 domain-containing transcription factor VRN1 [Glycine soja]|uniref:B3 domain-containing transcription factor VRN1 n=1 Tax=Glycine soja TaxID=3848 RepID=A0A445ITU2_GLYSO|nr:B3 domain-containing transcription factor VRN1 [Glycine soja]
MYGIGDIIENSNAYEALQCKNIQRIPRSFVNKCWEGISNPVVLVLPNGAEWKVNWKRLDLDVWLIDEWKKFAQVLSLDKDHLMVFRYVGNSQFQVVILDQSGLEVGYPLINATLDGEETGNVFHQRKKRAKSPLPISPSTKKVKTNPRKEPTNPGQDVETRHAESERTKAKKRGRRRMMYANKRCSKSKAFQSEELLEDNESSTALERANSFRSENPFFIRQMYPSYIQKHFMEKTWHVNFYLNRSSKQIILGAGWGDFVKDNNLKIGNVCVLEQIKKPGISFRVVIYRYLEESNPSKFPAKVILRVGNGSWPVRLDHCPKHSYCRLTFGWSNFMSACKLKAGDVCNLELVNKDRFVFQVRVARCIH